jgi:hypothetical protein
LFLRKENRVSKKTDAKEAGRSEAAAKILEETPKVALERLEAMLRVVPGAQELACLLVISELENIAFAFSSLIGEAARHRLEIPVTKVLDGNLRIATSEAVFDKLFKTLVELAPHYIAQVGGKDFIDSAKPSA